MLQATEEIRTDSVLAQQAVVGASLRTTAGVATAKMGRARVEKAARRENILSSEFAKTLVGSLLGLLS